MAAKGVAAEAPYRLYVPDNVGDKVAGSWTRGGSATIANFRTEKDVCPIRLPDIAEVHYLFPLDNERCPHLEVLAAAARSITHLGWGVDMVVANISILAEQEAGALPGERWLAAEDPGENRLRVPITGTLDALIAKHEAFLNRITRDANGNESFNPVPPLSAYSVVGYGRATDSIGRPAIVFHLRNDDDSFFRYPQRKLIHLAGMVRHLAIDLMKDSPPQNIVDAAAWVRTYVAGHREPEVERHRQFSYLPLPSIGHQHADPSVRRIMIAAPLGDDRWLHHLARLLEGQRLKPTRRTKLDHPPTLVRVRNDAKVVPFYTKSSTNWASVTPVILPGHDSHQREKTRRLIEKTLRQSGVDQPCEFDWNTFSHFPNSLSAHKHDRDKRQTGYIRPKYLNKLTATNGTVRP